MSSVGFLIFDGLWREISARVSRFVRSASGRTAEKRRNLARSKMRGFLRGRRVPFSWCRPRSQVAGGLKGFDLRVDVLELSVSVDMMAAFQALQIKASGRIWYLSRNYLKIG